MHNNQKEIILKKTVLSDLEHLFQFQMDEEACYLAAFTPKDPADKSSYLDKYSRLLLDPTVNNQTIFLDDIIIGSIAKFEIDGDAEITYWIDKKYWGKGLASKALQEFLKTECVRPIIGRVASDNIGSQKVLQRAGFIKIAEDSGFANARQKEIVEYTYRLE